MSSSTNVAAIFPGQGAQSVGMLGELAAEYPSIKTRFAQASEVLGFDLWAMTQQGPVEVLSQTENTQPALLVASVALWDLWPQAQEKVSVMSGQPWRIFGSCLRGCHEFHGRGCPGSSPRRTDAGSSTRWPRFHGGRAWIG